jgi:outer membrane lipoprotein-sorting protein
VAYADTDVNKVVKKMREKYKNAKTLLIDFKEISRFSLTGTETEVSASLYIENMNQFRLESEDQILVSNGETFWRYNKIENQVLIDYAKKGDQEILVNDILSEKTETYYTQLIREYKEDGTKLYVIKLTPKPDSDSFFQDIKVWVEDKSWEINKIIYTDYNENETEFQIEKIELNKELSMTTFTFEAPEGSEVVDVRF